MTKLTAVDIENMLLQKIQENLKVTTGKGKKQKILIKHGFKIMHLESGLVYTVDKVVLDGKKPVIHAHSGDGNPIELTTKDFKHYKGL
jgi:hypothetical protein